MRAEMVWLSHPNLPDGQNIHVPRVAVEIHKRSGWVEVESTPKPAGVMPGAAPQQPAEEKPVGDQPEEKPAGRTSRRPVMNEENDGRD